MKANPDRELRSHDRRPSFSCERARDGAARVVVDRDLCIGAGNCCGTAPLIFELDDEGKAILVRSRTSDGWVDASEVASALDAAWSCPTDAISVYDARGDRIYPRPDRRSAP